MPIDRRYKMPVERRMVGGRAFHYVEWRKTKKEAQEVADRIDRAGSTTRLFPFQHGWSIYIHS